MSGQHNDKHPYPGTPFDFWEPPEGHEARFRIRLERQYRPAARRIDWSRWFVAAAVVFLAAMLWWGQASENNGLPTSLNSMQTAKNRIENAIRREIIQWNADELPESRRIIQQAFDRLDRMENDFSKLRNRFDENQNSRILDAMIRNLRMQMQLLEDLQNQLEQLKKHQIDEKKVYQS